MSIKKLFKTQAKLSWAKADLNFAKDAEKKQLKQKIPFLQKKLNNLIRKVEKK
tara:strand:+ start:566 stop:724 length:159 start_codon:yes stop_codon:yes gene_type:complete